METLGWFARARAWFAGKSGRTLVFDALLGVIFVGLSVPIISSTASETNPGLLFSSSTLSMMLWELPIVVPMTLRRVRPELAAWLYVGLTAVHLLAGPAAVYSDFLAPVLLYSVLVYGRTRHTMRFVVAAFTMSLLTGAVWSAAFNLGPLFGTGDAGTIAWTGWLPTATTLPVCPGISSIDAVSSTSGSCGVKILEDAAVLAAIIGVSMLSVTVMAFWQRARRATVEAMRERNASIIAREAEETRIAALAERARIARDMHDVVAHTLSTIIVQSDGGRYAGAADLEVARKTMGTIRHEAERAQHDMQRLFSVFGTHAGNGYQDIPSLLDGSVAVSRSVSGQVSPDRLGAKASEAVFRLVQESLTNTRKHAGPGARAVIDEIWSDDMLSITIADNGRGAASAVDGHTPGYGLIGMRERIGSVGGSVTAGPGPNGGFIVTATIPLSPAVGTEGNAVPRDASKGVESNGHRCGSHSNGDGQSGTAPGSDEAHTRTSVMSFTPFSHAWARLWSGMRTFARKLKSKPLDQGDGYGLNWIGRLSQWTERHYLLVDSACAVVLMMLFDSATFGDLHWQTAYGSGLPHPVATAMTVILLAPLAFRRRFPEASALAVAIMGFLQLLVVPTVLTIDMFALVFVYSAVLYGRERAWRWVGAALVIDAWMFGVKVMTGWNGENSLARFVLSSDYGTLNKWGIVLSGLLPGGMVMLAGFACIAAARWIRSRGSNALVLQQREDALRAERERQKVLAANLERERIGAAMQAEVMATLESVIVQADEGLTMLNASPAPDGTQIAASFAAIGARGRAALAHMRGLLKVLRETGFSDEAHAGVQPSMQLAPAASLDSQLHAAAH
ncbi:sensor histidine kinase [Bifidobacterium callitrichidarum]|uniref:sensor histidine kinase n=1 Tax=Bifidobacterium callitrichidarum TaxID=2052941 RepID=UPI001F4EAF61|nr:histidine kinase [Bifidobacterium callitrichidarum]